MTPSSLQPLLDAHRVLLCVGSGGVGKTTVTAALGLAAAQRGKRVLCLTIDPARRLANSLGLERMTSDATRVEPQHFERHGLDVKGSLTVMMLDTKRTFDELVIRHASSPAARDRILENKLYQYVSTNLAGTQEYMAMEKLLSVKADAEFDLIVLDTPPTSNALDFLDAPERLLAALDSGAMRWLIQSVESSGRFSLNLVAKSVAVVLKGIGRLTGGGFLEQMAGFVSDLNDLFGGFRQRAEQTAAAFRGDEFAYIMVTTPAPAAIREALYFAERLEASGMRRDAIVVNRVNRPPPPRPTLSDVRAAMQAHSLSLGAGGGERLLAALDDERARADVDAKNLEILAAQSEAGVVRVDVPALPSDVHDLGTLAGISALLCP
ncbi:MAG TPA: ArsA-related P-loop ATPase [Polyangiaceae bacterium]|nr:ArsA-related P-loop ATPase [Polyangiaceae bacterium]